MQSFPVNYNTIRSMHNAKAIITYSTHHNPSWVLARPYLKAYDHTDAQLAQMNRKFSPFLAQYSAHLQACQLFVSFSTVVWGNKIWLQSSSMLFSLYSSCKTPRAYLHYSRLLFNYEVFVRRRSSRSRPSSQKVIARMRLLHKIKCFLIKSSVAPSPPYK